MTQTTETATQEVDIVPVGQVPPLGVVPKKMHAWVIRPERFGEPTKSFQTEEMPVWDIGPDEVIVQVMAAGINYNAIWAGLGEPVNILKSHGLDFHIAGSDASGVVWKVGSAVRNWKVGDEVVLHCNHLVEAGVSDLQTIWGYETPDGSFAQFTRAQAQQLLPKPKDLTWEDAASYGLTYFTAHRMLIDRAEIQPGEDVLVWGGGGGLGVFAIQLCKAAGARAIAVVSSDEKAKLAMELGAHGVINRKDFPNLQYRPPETPEQTKARFQDMKAFGKKIWEILGEKKSVEVVFEHVGQRTFPASVWLASKYGRIVICGATTGYELTFDVRHLWMQQKRIIGSHFADADSSQRANRLVQQGLVRPVMTKLFTWDEIANAHQEMYENKLHGTVSALVGAPKPGLKNYEETLEAMKG
ncbi:MAG TPA: crotonyl-CoA carboxylase/reductase [Polyangiaceae bacterium LLY-WYZ-15_(1-7)]|nr:crotonyl-CoA carboxylase/reductase [Sandaracinus sp.]HJK92253.1 crotonyl-CoA carboxylase/reductase [Polyangiaceae bacterium LLY-WYZ-15_(1-7)]MBJ73588.1 crotonyl-CoA carboxylase/reductase [Sandaracinus sp.]HJL03298.1 crotonyl-CoA carboxylase/reductase [Polyangiaceae bacterium LLY-WYZ-15_(1-7)]HJL10683.1 crotonyl-CoA carboxylase/reductase [Polyangiaceae bacterium LLY-WYZ-15_(1-7)]